LTTQSIVIENLHKRYRNNHAVRGVTLNVEQGEIFGIVGPNGAGKTTTIEIMEGLRKRDSGTVQILGLDPNREAHQLRQRIGVQFQTTSIQENMKVKEAIHLFQSFYHRHGDVDKIVSTLGLADSVNKKFKDLSGGWKQRLTLALAVIHDPEIVFLDEPSTGLDPQARRELWDLILQLRDEGKTIVLTTHYMEEAERLCDRIAMFRKGQIVALESPKRLVTSLASANFLSFESEQANPALIESLPGVERVEKNQDTVKVYSPVLQKTALHVFELADRQQWTIGAFKFEIGTLDDLFVHMVDEGAVQ
jgi:ABC-2 type transport system ATP-binding protein